MVDVTVLTPTTTRVIFELDVAEFFANPAGTLHGGAQAAIYDMCTSMALAPASKPGFWMSHVSRVLSVTYLRPAALGETLIVECEVSRVFLYRLVACGSHRCQVIHAGQRLAVVHGVMRRKRDGAVVSTCEHNKASTDPDVGSKL